MVLAGADGLVTFPVRDLFGVPIHAATRAEAVSVCESAVDADTYLLVGVINVAKLVTLQENRELREAVSDADLVVADGMGVVWASKILGKPLPERVAGIDLFLDLIASAERRDNSVFLLGAEQDVLDECARVLRETHPSLDICGTRNGYFDSAEAQNVAEQIAESGANMLFVAMPSPQKETFLSQYGESLGVSVCHGVGGSFDVVAGKVQRAPEAWQRWGAEWLFRLIQEPRRMWKRYLTTNSAFAWMVLSAKLRSVIGGGGARGDGE